MEGLCGKWLMSPLTRDADRPETLLSRPTAPGSIADDLLMVGMIAFAIVGVAGVGLVGLSFTVNVLVIPTLAVAIVLLGAGSAYTYGPPIYYQPSYGWGHRLLPSFSFGDGYPSHTSYVSPSFFGGNSGFSRPSVGSYSRSPFFGGRAGAHSGLRVFPGMRGVLV